MVLYSLEPNYVDLFLKSNSKELIYERRVADSNDFERANYPIGFDGGNTGTCPSQNLVDAYEMQSTGLGIDQNGSGYNEKNPTVVVIQDFTQQLTIIMHIGLSEILKYGRVAEMPPIQNSPKQAII